MADKLRRGFKAEAERMALSIRAELGLSATDPLDPLELAKHVEIPVISLLELRTYGASTESISRLMLPRSGFSALTICHGTCKLIVYNPRHPKTRQANSLVHEVCHPLLGHPPAPALGAGGCRYWDSESEAEADWQAAALLVPRDGAFALLRSGADFAEGAGHFGVSLALFRWRINKTGVARQLAALERRTASR